jgi:hypothetical protein
LPIGLPLLGENLIGHSAHACRVSLSAASSADETGLVEANFGHHRASICRLAAIDFAARATV